MEYSLFNPFILSLWFTFYSSQSILLQCFSFSLGLEDLNGSPSVKGRFFLMCLIAFVHSPEHFPLLQFPESVLPGNTYFMLIICLTVLQFFSSNSQLYAAESLLLNGYWKHHRGGRYREASIWYTSIAQTTTELML